MGYAATRCLGEGAPLLAVIFLAAALAGLHRLARGMVEMVIGLGGLLASVSLAAADPGACTAALGEGGRNIVLLYGSIMLLSGIIRLLGSASPREMARHLLVGTAALELGLFTLSPVGQQVATTQSRFSTPAVLTTMLFLATVVGIRARSSGPALLGIGLVATQVAILIGDSPCAVHPGTALAGSLTFAAVAVFLSSRDDEPLPDGLAPDERAPYSA